MDSVRLTFQPDNEWSGELSAEAKISGFAARGSAWFDRSNIEEFFDRLSQYPLADADRVELIGGVGIRPDGVPEHVRLRLSISPFGSRGLLLVQVDLSEETLLSGPSDLVQSASLKFITTYGAVDRFRSSSGSLLEGGAEAILFGEK